MSLPTTLFGPDPETIEKLLADENKRNGHIGKITRYSVSSETPPTGFVCSFVGWDDLLAKYRSTFGELRSPIWQANVSYEEKP